MDLALDEIERIARFFPGGVAVYQMNGGITCLYASPEVKALAEAGASIEAIQLGADGLAPMMPADRQRLMAALSHAVENGEDLDATYRIFGKNSEITWLHINAREIGTFEGKHVLLCSMVNASLENREQRNLVEYSQSPTYMIDAETFEMLYINDPCVRFFSGKKPLAGQTCYGYKHGFAERCPWCPIPTMAGPSTDIDEFYDKELKSWYRFHYRKLTWFGINAIAVYAFDITEHKREMAELERSKHTYQSAIEAAQLVIWEYDISHHRVTMADDRYTKEDRLKFDLPHIIEDVPSSIANLVDDEYVGTLLEMYRQVDAGEDASCEVWYKSLPGREARCERISYQVEHDNNDIPIKAHGIGRNITAEKKVEERYQREMETLQGNADDTMVFKSRASLTDNVMLDYTLLQDSPLSAQPGQGYDEALASFLETVDKTTSDTPLEQLLSRENLIHRYQNGAMHLNVDFRCSVPGHVPVWLSLVMHTYMVPATGDLEAFSYTYDITDQVLKQQIASKLTKLGYDELGFIYPSSNSFTIYHIERGDGKVFKSTGGYASEVDNYVSDPSIPPQEVNKLRANMRLENIVAQLKTDKMYAFTHAAKRTNRKVRQKLMQYFYLDDTQDAIFSCLSDITDQYEAELAQIDELHAAKLEADQANEAKSSFLASMSHDIRTPLNGVIGFTDLALRETDESLKQGYLQRVKSSSELLLDLVNDTLELSCIENGKMTLEPETVGVRDVVETVVASMKPSAEFKGVTLEEDLTDVTDETIWVDKLKVQKIFLNLISNAIKYTPKGGNVQVTATIINPPENGCNHRVVIQDNGIGMSEDFQKRLYEPFTQEKRLEAANILGTGLGLSIVKRIVDLMQGRIFVESAVGQGTRFQVDLPILKVETLQKPREASHGSAKMLNGKRVMLCEDNWMNAEIASILLQEKGMTVDVFKDGEEGLDAFAASAEGAYDVILMDVHMPHMDGREATRSIRALDRADAETVPIIAMTVDAFEEDVRLNLEAGMVDQVTKPISPDQLFGSLTKALRTN